MIQIIYLCLLIILPHSSFSETLDSQEALRTLFTSSHTRQQLDKLREQGKFDKHQQAPSASIFNNPITIKMQGVVFKGDTKPVVFVNDGNTLKSLNINDEIVISNENISKNAYHVPVRVNQQSLKLKPGQQWSEVDPYVQDSYQIKPPEARISVTDKMIKNVNNLKAKVP